MSIPMRTIITGYRARARATAVVIVVSMAVPALPLRSVLAQAQRAEAQRPARRTDAGNVAALADSIAAAGDTTRAYALLDSALRKNPKDAAGWLQFGLLNWNMAKSKRSPQFISDKRTIRLLQGADTALRLATQFAPDSARYWLVLSKFNLTSGVSTMRFAATGEVGSAFDAVSRTGDSLLLAVAADEVGMATWRRYEAIAYRALTSDNQRIQLTSFNNWSRDKARDYVESFAKRIEPPTGNTDFVNALEKFRIALQADPTNLRISRHVYMALGERGRWEEMRELGAQRGRRYPLDYQSWLARGLASHRLNDEVGATIAFDSAFALMDDGDRDRMTRFTRVLRPRPGKNADGQIGDTIGFAKLPPAQQRGLEAMYWMLTDPLSLTRENEHRLEFLSRVTYADFRWTNEDVELLGADSDRGDIHVRYGPADLEMTIPGTTSGTEGGTALVWMYNNGLVFFFDLPPGFGTARFAFSDRDNVEQMKSALPVTWDNIAATKLLDTIPLRIARFRSGVDSSDLVIAARVPLDSLVRGLDFARAPVDMDIRVFDQFVRVRGVESEQMSIRPDSARAPLAKSWTRRIGPGINVIRIEAQQADSRRSARAVTRLNPVAGAGFGMSDVLLGTTPVPRDANTAPKRWRDVAMEPSVGTYAAGAPIGLVWEMYDLVARDGQSKYRLAIVVERTGKGGVGFAAAKLLDGLGRAIGRTKNERDRLTISFDRAVAAAATQVEFLKLDLSSSPVGEYRLRVEVTDLQNQMKTSRQTEFRIR